MSYITREDGERFVIPSYRDVLTETRKNILKKEILLLSENYGEYITIQKKGHAQYELAFSPEPGYLLGESIWHFFNRPANLIFCEAIPNTTEAILVIVRSGSVYLDGRFPIETIPEELIIFKTQDNHFDIYIHGDVPISETPEINQFSFDSDSVNSFTVLEDPIFPTLPLLNMFEFQLVENALVAQGIGTFSFKPLLIGVVLLGLLWMMWSYFNAEKVELPGITVAVNPYQLYNQTLTTPSPQQEINQAMDKLNLLFTITGWTPTTLTYKQEKLEVAVQSAGNQVSQLQSWANENNAMVNIKQDGIYLVFKFDVPDRPIPKQIFQLQQVISLFVDRLGSVYPGNHLKLGEFNNRSNFTDTTLTINFNAISPLVLKLIGAQSKDLPMVLQELTATVTNGSVSGSMILQAVGS